MVYQYDLENKCLYSNDVFLPPVDCEITEIGTCFKCGGHLKSLSAHILKENILGQDKHLIISSCTKCSSIYVNIYDHNWSWLDDAEPEFFESKPEQFDKTKKTDSSHTVFKIPVYSDIINTPKELEMIPKEQLEAVFSSTEIEAIFHKAKNEKNVRQYYHRARMKYEKFEKIFGIKINI